ncbi:MAG TPA: hypothetical protein VM937_10745 [Burkholderiaceae bacterium]|jgi:hypothetical protein|nr:hypothetical protein [Burkholderiaceae bacterium]
MSLINHRAAGSWKGPADNHMLLLRAPMYRLVALVLVIATPPCAAQLRLDVMSKTTPLVPQQQTSADGSRSSMQQNSGSTSQAFGSRSFYGTSASESTWLGSAIQMEAPRATATGQYTRPKVIFGLPSDSMRSFMNSVGFTTERCMLPTLKARAKVGAGGDVDGGTFWVSARCTFY